LQIDEAGREHRSDRHNFGWPVTCTLITRRDTLNHPTIDQDDGIIVPPISIENTVSRNCKLRSSGVFGWFWTHRLTSSLATFAGPVDPLIDLQYALSRCPAHQRNSGS
jgi:hypothetical protein